MFEALEQGQAQIILLPEAVQMWMNWLNIVFLLALFFVKNHQTARWSILAYLSGFVLGAAIFYRTGSIELLGIPHIVFWLPLLIYVVRSRASTSNFQIRSVYDVWVALLALTIVVSLFLDIKALITVIAS